MKRLLKIILAIATLYTVATTVSWAMSWYVPDEVATGMTEVMPPAVDTPDFAADSLRQSLADSLTARASGLYRQVRFLKADKADADSLFAKVYEAYDAVLEALGYVDRQTLQHKTMTDILVSIDGDMEAGAYHYSSQQDAERLNKYARAYLDIQLMDETAGINFKRAPEAFSQMAYIAASDAYNKAEYDRAIDYFKLFFSTGVGDHRESVYTFMGQACFLAGRYDLAITTMAEGMKLYPDNPNLPMIGFQACINGKQPQNMHGFLERAVKQNPDDLSLLEAQGKLYEDDYEFKKAMEIFEKIDQMQPKHLNTAKHIALCYYNIAVDYFNEANNEANEKSAIKLRRQAKSYFSAAADRLEEIVTADPTSVRYLTMLARSYLGLEEKDKFEGVNRKLGALGADAITDMFNIPIMGFNENGGPNYEPGDEGERLFGDKAPTYTEFATEYIKKGLKDWVKKGEFEPIEHYNARVNETTIQDRYRTLRQCAQSDYLDNYASTLHLADIKLKPYDTVNETFLIETCYGPITIHVPNTEREAETFKQNWEGMRFRNPRYIISDDKVVIASVTISAPYGKSYTYDSGQEPAYSQTLVMVDLEAILKDAEQQQSPTKTSESDTYVITKKSDVDVDIPVTGKTQSNTFALIIANENYSNVSKVHSAVHDGEVFAEYCRKTLGLPETNISLYKNATYGTMIGAIDQLRNLVNSWGDKAEVIFYYAGHGMPDEKTHDAYILPVDAIPSMTSTGISLDKLYSALEELKTRSVIVFMDACFSGATRDGDMLYSARGVVLDPNESAPRGNMFALCAASGKETAMHYAEKNHGLFTYFLLKKIQETKGNVTLQDLADYVTKNVSRTANLVNKKPQTPTVSTSGSMSNLYKTKKLR